jgi:NAD(P)-dependent dehydrogenase (short-subunit alcohol dehydrogenase family)
MVRRVACLAVGLLVVLTGSAPAAAFVTPSPSRFPAPGFRRPVGTMSARARESATVVKMNLERRGFLNSAAAAAVSALLPAFEAVHAAGAGSLPVVLVTGASSGIGKALSENLAASGAVEVVLGCRTTDKAKAAAGAILAAHPGAAVRCLSTGLEHSDLASVTAFAAELRASAPELGGLVFCAGIDGAPQTSSKQGLELHLQVNHLASVALYAELSGALREGAPVASFTSSAALDADPAALADISGKGRAYNKREAYCVSKACQVAWGDELARRRGAALTVFSVPPRRAPPASACASGGEHRPCLRRHCSPAPPRSSQPRPIPKKTKHSEQRARSRG